MRNFIMISGKARILLLRDGRIIDSREIDNLVVNTGLSHIADQLSASPNQSAMSHMAIGTGTTSPAAGDTSLENEVARVALESRTDSGASITYVAEFTAGAGTGAITEAGIFNASSGGTMLARNTFAAVNKGSNDTLRIEWTITFQAS